MKRSDEREAPVALHADALARLEGAAARLGLAVDPRWAQPARAVALRVTGPTGPVTAWRARQATGRWALGPWTVDPGLDADGVAAGALWTHLQAALLGLPVDGAYGGTAAPVCAKGLALALAPELQHDVLGPDRGVDAAWLGALAHGLGPDAPVVGLPAALGGGALRPGAVARGGLRVLDAFLRQVGWPRDRLRVAIHGFGPVGRAALAQCQGAGLRVVAVCDAQRGAHSAAGLTPEALADGFGTVGAPVTPDALLRSEVDVLVLASGARALDAEIAGALRCRAVLELARFGVLSEADPILLQRGVAVLPHLLAGAGGLLLDHALWQGRRAGRAVDDEALANGLTAGMDRAFRQVWAAALGEGLPARTAALAVALRHLAAVEAAQSGRASAVVSPPAGR
ncbi:MAG: hypothetical protein H6702_06860 [Myxococcales bacterium]|nr:hypothetical protein [Myxococcales bacterium]